MKKILRYLFLSLIFCACQSKVNSLNKPVVIRVAISANLQPVIKDLKNVFEKKNNIKLELIVGSSGKLSNQILHNAPYHIFLSADTAYPNYLYQKEHSLQKPKIYIKGLLALWSKTKVRKVDIESYLLSENCKKIAIALPKLAPYGKLAKKKLQDLGIYEKVKHKIIYAESISQVNQYIALKSVDVAFTSQSVQFIPNLKNINNQLIVFPKYTASQAMILTRFANESLESSQKFYDFLSKQEARKVFEDFGYVF